MELLHPGVYIQEVSSGVKPIEGVSTSTAGFLGKAEKGPLDRAVLVTSFAEFQSLFGGFLGDSFLAQSALQFFNNGGTRLYVLRIAKNAATADIGLGDRKGSPAKTITIAANSAGKFGNELDVEITNGTRDPGNEFRIIVRRAGTTLETHDNLSIDPAKLNFADNVITAASRTIRATVERANDSTVAGKSVSGASPATTLPAGVRKLVININGDGPQTITPSGAVTTGTEIAAAILGAVQALTPLRNSTNPTAFSSFTAGFATGIYTLTSGTTGKGSSVEISDASSGNAATLLKLGRTNGGTEETGAAILRPAVGNFNVGDNTVAGAVISVTAGSDGTTPQEADFMAGFSLLDRVRDVNLLAVPGFGSKAMCDFGVNYCRGRGDCFFIGDMGITDDTKEEAKAFVEQLTVKSSYGAVYFPWLRATDPSGASAEPIALPPSGFAAGLYARLDARRGVWKAPAGTEANIGGAVGLLKEITDAEQDVLNPVGVNALRMFPASGLVVWGARTLSTQSDPEYRYIPVRRTAIFLEQSIYNGIQYAVFEPNDEPLWASLRLNINAFMMLQFRAGAFQGRTPNEAFFVKVDAQTTTQADIDAGIVNIIVGFAPLKPAEFVVLKLTQKVGQASA